MLLRRSLIDKVLNQKEKNEPNKAVEPMRMLVTNRAFSSLREGTIRAKHTHGSLLTLGKKIMKYLIVVIFSLLISGCQSPSPNAVNTPPPIVENSSPAPDYDKPVDVWLVPVLGFPDSYTKDLVARLIEDGSIHVRSSVDVGISDSLFFPDNKQMISEKALMEFSRILPSLSNAKPNAVYIFLTAYDLNGEDRRFRFLFAQNNPKSRMAIISISRLRFNQDGPSEAPSITKLRLFKMAKRQIGELYYGYSRNTDPNSVMYSPLMGLDELDMIGTKY